MSVAGSFIEEEAETLQLLPEGNNDEQHVENFVSGVEGNLEQASSKESNVNVEAGLRSNADANENLDQVVLKLYSSHFLSAWGIRQWEFAAGLVEFPTHQVSCNQHINTPVQDADMGWDKDKDFRPCIRIAQKQLTRTSSCHSICVHLQLLLRLQNSSLLLVSLLGLFSGLAVILLGGWLGSWIDRTDRLQAACQFYILQNAAVLLSATCALLASWVSSGWIVVLIVSIIGTTALGDVAAVGSTLSVEKDWVKQLLDQSAEKLATTNASMRRIDLICLIASPILVGFLMTYGGDVVAVIYIIIWNLVSWGPECILLRSAYHQVARLRVSKSSSSGVTTSPSKLALACDGKACKSYFMQRTVLPGMSLALLYLTVLSFGLLMTAYLNWKGITEAELSIFRALGAGAGILATFCFPPLQRRSGLPISGKIGVWMQFCCLMLPLAAEFFSPILGIPELLAARLLLVGLVFSRFGLWMFDLAVSQMLQTEVPDQELGAVNGVQGSLCSLFASLSYMLGTIVSGTHEFKFLMLGSAIMVLVSAVCFTWHCSLLAKQGADQRRHDESMVAVISS